MTAESGSSYASAGLVILGLTVPGAIMSMYLPSPSTAYDKTSGRIASGPESVKFLRRGELVGGGLALGIAAGAALTASKEMGAKAAWIFIGAALILAAFLWDYERAIRIGNAEAATGET